MTLLPSGWDKVRPLFESPPATPPKAVVRPDSVSITATQLHTQNLEDVYRYVARRIKNREDAEDVTAEVFAAAFEALPRFRGEVEPRLWLLGIARHKVVDWLRKSGHRHEATWDTAEVPEEPTPRSADPSHALMLQERRLEMRELLAGLKGEQREALLLKYVEELSIDEISIVMGRSKAAINSLLQRSRATAFRQGRRYFLELSNPEAHSEVKS
ncbi:RNA polymerase sigma factor [bacterium]|nr:MAG: RNA polymerase sigma factor [bacterium]